MKKKIENINFYFLVSFLLILFLLSIFKTFNFIELKYISYFLYFGGFISLIIYFYSLINNVYKKNKYDYIIYILMGLALLSCCFAYNTNVSIFGYPNRYEGLFSLLSYYFLFLNYKNFHSKDKQNIFILLVLIVGLFNACFGFLQVISFWFNKISIAGNWYYAKGFFGNSNFFGTYMVICYAISLFYLRKEKNILSYVILDLFIMGVIISGALSAYLAVGCLMIVYFIIDIKSKFKYHILNKIIIFNVISGSTLLFLFANFVMPSLKKDINNLFGDVYNISQNKVDEKTGSSRFYIWSKALEKFDNYCLTGVGLDNFAYIDDGKPITNPKVGELYDKAHNEYIQTLVSEGVITLLFYLFFLYNIIKDNYKKEAKKGLIQMIVAYQIQAFFNISVIRIAPIYYVLMGFAVEDDNGKN